MKTTIKEEETIKQPTIWDIAGSLKIINQLLTRKDKKNLIASAFLIMISSIMEVATISTIYPFLAYAFNDDSSQSSIGFINFDYFFGGMKNSLWALSAAYIGLILVSFMFKIYVLRLTGMFVAKASNNLTCEVFERTIFGQTAIKASAVSSQEIISNILLRCNYAMGVYYLISNSFAALVLIIGVVYTLIYANPIVTIIGSISIICCYLITLRITAKTSVKNGEIIDSQSIKPNKTCKPMPWKFKKASLSKTELKPNQKFSETLTIKSVEDAFKVAI